MKVNSLYLVSTPRHLYQALALAYKNLEHETAYLIVTAIKMDSPLIDIVKNDESSPFFDILFINQGKPGSFSRVQNFSNVKQKVTTFLKPVNASRIFVGNDKKPLSQWVLYQAKLINPKSIACYVDEGIASYFYGFSQFRKVTEWLEAKLKRVIYGSWYQMPLALGTSKYITEALFSFPDEKQKIYESKDCKLLDAKLFKQKSVVNLCEKILSKSGLVKSDIEKLDAIFLMPSLNLVDSIYGGLHNLKALINAISNKGLNIGLKYHPKDANGSDELEEGIENLVRIPVYLPIEMLYPLVSQRSMIIGDVSSALFTAKWLLPDNTLYSIASEASIYSDTRKPLFDAVGIDILTADSLLGVLTQV